MKKQVIVAAGIFALSATAWANETTPGGYGAKESGPRPANTAQCDRFSGVQRDDCVRRALATPTRPASGATSGRGATGSAGSPDAGTEKGIAPQPQKPQD